MKCVGIEKVYDRESGSFVGVRLHSTDENNPFVEGTAVEGLYCRNGYVDCSNVRVGDTISPIYRYGKLVCVQVLNNTSD